MRYDHEGNRVAKLLNNSPTYYLVDDQNPSATPRSWPSSTP